MKNNKLFLVILGSQILSITCLSGCGGNKNTANPLIWTAPGTLKIHKTYDQYDKSSKTLEYHLFRNEYESAQIIITPDTDVSYTITLSDLKNEKGTVLSSDYFEVYNQKYIEVSLIKEQGNEMGSGFYPDALLPFNKAVEYHENVAKANENQGIWINLKTSKLQEAGNYKGNFTLNIENKSYSVPVEVELYNYTLSDETHVKTHFGVNEKDIGACELDTSIEMQEKYFDFMLDYRISAISNAGMYWGDRNTYIERLIKYTKDERCTSFPIYWYGTSAQIEITPDGRIAIGEDRGKTGNSQVSVPTVEFSVIEQFLGSEILKASFDSRNAIDLYKKLNCYFYIFDEMDSTLGFSKINSGVYTMRRFDDYVQKLIYVVNGLTISNGVITQYKNIGFNESQCDAGRGGYTLIDQKTTFQSGLSGEAFEELRAQIVHSLSRLKIITTNSELNDYLKNNASFSICPTIRYYNSKELRNYVNEYEDSINADAWVYTCENPPKPFPTYHIDDELLSSRLLNWMMYEYDIQGNLFWASHLCRYTDSSRLETQITGQDYYTEPLRYPTQNGDGYLTYPGRPYGIYGPVPSVRLMSIRDGNEDYDLLYELEAKYRERGVSDEQFENIMSLLTRKLYNGTTCNYGSDYLSNFATSRQILGKLFNLMENYGVFVENYDINGDPVKLIVSTDKGVDVTFNGQKMNGTENTDFVRYELPFSYGEGKNNVPTFSKDGNSDSINLNLTIPPINISPTTLNGLIAAKAGSVDQSSNIEVKEIEGIEGLGINFDADGKQTLSIDLNLATYKISRTYSSLQLNIYSAYDGELILDEKAVLSNSDGVSTSIESIKINKGWNEINIDLLALLSQSTVTINNLKFNIKKSDNAIFDSNVFIAISKISAKE